MADPRLVESREQMKANLSPLMKAQAKMMTGQKVNVCPFGCPDEELDEHGYCHHLIGFTTDQKTYEPMITKFDAFQQEVGRVVQVPLKKVNGRMVPDCPKIPHGAKLERITTSYRVYADVERPTPPPLVEDEDEETEAKPKKLAKTG